MTHPVFHLQKPSHAVEFALRAAFPHTPARKQTPPLEKLQKKCEEAPSQSQGLNHQDRL